MSIPAEVNLKPSPTQPINPEEFDISGHYKPEEDLEAKKYLAPESYATRQQLGRRSSAEVSPTGPRPPPRHKRGSPRAAWESPQYAPPRPNAPPPETQMELEKVPSKAQRLARTGISACGHGRDACEDLLKLKSALASLLGPSGAGEDRKGESRGAL